MAYYTYQYTQKQIKAMQTHTDTQKITAHIPKSLLQEAQNVTGEGITETLKEGLSRIARETAYTEFLKLRGTHKFSIDINELRKDRNEP